MSVYNVACPYESDGVVVFRVLHFVSTAYVYFELTLFVSMFVSGLDWPLCHCAMTQATPFDEHRRPLRKKLNVLRALAPPPGNVVKCFVHCGARPSR